MEKFILSEEQWKNEASLALYYINNNYWEKQAKNPRLSGLALRISPSSPGATWSFSTLSYPAEEEEPLSKLLVCHHCPCWQALEFTPDLHLNSHLSFEPHLCLVLAKPHILTSWSCSVSLPNYSCPLHLGSPGNSNLPAVTLSLLPL